MIEKQFVVENRLGLHARPASLFVQTGAKFRCEVKVRKEANGENMMVNGKSVMGLMMLAAACGEHITITLDGPDEEDAVKAFEELFATKFSEE